ncbi:protein-tyrosine phosphatase [Apiospora phragmitis]|uniref:Protein-tyrosine phosphatase n=1 Tax=Apiospora phragmitis TaxID=2905665 RepID=A0ABR1WTT6_9PEZI
MTSPRMPHSVGQPYPPTSKLSPAVPTDLRSPSPNYFGLNIDPAADPRDSAVLPRSTGARLPPQDRPSFPGLSHPRSETLPTALAGSDPSLIMPSQLKDIVENTPGGDYLLLDVRVSTNYAQSRIEGALNLCIPTTLLKRATFNLEKLQKTLQTEEDQEKFAQWREVKNLIIYDAASFEKRDALSAMNMFKKFAAESFSGMPIC